jgi:hypothetical protein
MFCKGRTIAYLFLIFAFFVSSVLAQENPYPNTVPPRGITPLTDILSSPIDAIDPMSGKLSLAIPLATLPPGPGGIGFDLALTYDSNLYDAQPEAVTGRWNYPEQEPQDHLLYYSHLVNKNSSPWNYSGGWNYNINNYGLYLEQRPYDALFDDYYRGQGYLEEGECSEKNVEKYRLRVGLPDGSMHILYLPGYIHSVTDGFYGIMPDGMVNTDCSNVYEYGWFSRNNGEPLTYFTLDGSYLKLEIPTATGASWTMQQWTLYFPDGKIVKGRYVQAQEIIDANGNKIIIENISGANPYTRISDEIGPGSANERAIVINYHTESAQGLVRDEIEYRGPNNEQLVTAIDWQWLYIPGIPYNAYPQLYQDDRYIHSSYPNNLLKLDSDFRAPDIPPRILGI